MNGYTGRLFEEEVVGKCRWATADYVPYRKAMDVVKRFQPGDPSDPRSPVMNDFRALVCKELGRESSAVKCFTAVGSPLDRFHGVDGFIEVDGVAVTLDLTVSKKDEYKADIILHEDDVYDGEGMVNQPRLQEIARDVVQLLRRRTQPTLAMAAAR